MTSKSLLGRTALYGLSIVLMRGVSLIMLPLVTGTLTTTEFGQLELLTSIAIFASVILSFGLEDALFRFCGTETNPNKQRSKASEIYSLGFILSLSLTLLSFAFLYTFEPWISVSFPRIALMLILATVAMESIIAIPLAWLRMHDRALTFCTISVLRALLQASLTFAFLFFGFG